MKAEKQRKITDAQVASLEGKLIILEGRRRRAIRQATPLKITLRKYIQQNMKAVQRYAATDGPGSDMLTWAVAKIKHGYFADATLKNLIKIAHILKVVKWQE